jgi:hypothetical protein
VAGPDKYVVSAFPGRSNQFLRAVIAIARIGRQIAKLGAVSQVLLQSQTRVSWPVQRESYQPWLSRMRHRLGIAWQLTVVAAMGDLGDILIQCLCDIAVLSFAYAWSFRERCGRSKEDRKLSRIDVICQSYRVIVKCMNDQCADDSSSMKRNLIGLNAI